MNKVLHEPIRLPESHCFTCGNLLDAATGIGASYPKEGDICVCFYCGTVARYKADQTLRKLTDAELEVFKQYMQQFQPRDWALIEAMSEEFAKNQGKEPEEV